MEPADREWTLDRSATNPGGIGSWALKAPLGPGRYSIARGRVDFPVIGHFGCPVLEPNPGQPEQVPNRAKRVSGAEIARVGP